MNQTAAPPLELPLRESDAHKGNFGRVALVGGSRGMAGSIALSAMAALRCGSGLVTALVPHRCLETVASFHPCMMTVPLADDIEGRFAEGASGPVRDWMRRVDALACGPGMTTGTGSIQIVEALLADGSASECGVVFDADALNVVAEIDWLAMMRQGEPRLPYLKGRWIWTPHPGELQRLSGASPKDRQRQIEAASEIASRSGVVVVVKGGPTVVVDGSRQYTNTTGNPGMATAGTGDVLTGVITSLLGQGLSAWDAARLGVWIHGRAGDLAANELGQYGMLATDVLDRIPRAVQDTVVA